MDAGQAEAAVGGVVRRDLDAEEAVQAPGGLEQERGRGVRPDRLEGALRHGDLVTGEDLPQRRDQLDGVEPGADGGGVEDLHQTGARSPANQTDDTRSPSPERSS